MTVYYLDFKDGNDSNDGTSFANRKKTIQSFGSTPGGGDEIRVAGQPSTLVDANAKIINGFGDGTYGSSHNCTITYSTSTGETSLQFNGHGLVTGEWVGLWNNTQFSTARDRVNGYWRVTVVDSNNFKIDGYTPPDNSQSSGNCYMRYFKTQVIELSSAVTKDVAACNQEDEWNASTNVTTSSEGMTSGVWSSNDKTRTRGYSDKIAIGADFTTGKAAWQQTGGVDLSSYQQISFNIGQDSGTKSSSASPNVSLVLCTDTNGDVGVHTMPVYTGPDTATTTRMWRFMRKDFGTNLNSSIQSVALYVDTDQGAQTFYIDNIIACKASSAADSLTLDSMVGIKTSPDCPWYNEIKGIKDKYIFLSHMRGNAPTYHPFSYYTPSQIFYGIGVTESQRAQTIPIYKITPLRLKEDLDTDLGTSSSTTYPATAFNNNVGGASTTNRITISGGWDASNSMASQLDGGYTAVDGINSYNEPISFRSIQNADISRFIGMRGYYSLQTQSCSYCNFLDLGSIGGQYGMHFNGNSRYMNVHIWGSHANYAACRILSPNAYEYTGIRTAFAHCGGGYSMEWQSMNNVSSEAAGTWDRLEGWVGNDSCIFFGYNSNKAIVNRVNCGMFPRGAASSKAFYIYSNTVAPQVGILSCYSSYYLAQVYNTRGTLIDYFYENMNFKYSRSNGGAGTIPTQYAIRVNTSSDLKILAGGATTSQYYINQGPLYINNVVDNYTGSHYIQSPHAIYAKNYDGVAGSFINMYQNAATLQPETSIRHTSSGVSWKIDLTSSQPIGSPINWLLTKLVVNASAQVTCKIWVYRDGTGVNGGLRVKAGALGGITSTVDAVITDTTINSWVECSLTFTPTEAGVVDIFAIGYYIDNASHNVYLDDFSASQA